MSMRRTVFFFLLASTAFAMDAERGKQVMRDQNCLACHNVRGEGGMTAPDLAARLIDDYTPASLASLLWNHLPEMWSAMRNDQVARPRPAERDSEDMFAFLYSAHFLNPAGTQARGERAFEQRGCAACHSAGPGTPVENWRGISDPFALVQQMWNHASLMRASREQRGVVFEKLSSRDLADLTAFVTKGAARSTPSTMPETRQGEALFKSNCGACHPAIVNLQQRMRDRTPAEVAAGLWNHANSMQNVPLAAPNDMRSIVGYVWNLQFQDTGNPIRGAKTFEDKGCAGCHAQMARGERVYTTYSMISLSWVHGPLMVADTANKRPRWPRLSPEDISNLVAYMNTQK
jgi:mono/diheme cytochrome c family protein